MALLRHGILLTALTILTATANVAAQAAAPAAPTQAPAPAAKSFSLDQALQYAVDHYPTVRAALEQQNAANANMDVARSAYLPRLDSLWQLNRATANNLFGQLLPQSSVLDASGEVLVPRFLAMVSVIAVFVPSFFMTGVSRSLFVPLSLAVGCAMIASFLLSGSLVPILSVCGSAGTTYPRPRQSRPPTGSNDRESDWRRCYVASRPRAGCWWRRMRL
jgi:hypothetical protein